MSEAFPGRFIVLDGPEGCGKTTQVQRLVARLREEGRQATAVHDPGSTPVSERIRGLLLDQSLPEMDLNTEILLFMASRAEMVKRIVRPLLEAGLVVIGDRFVSSTVAYQGYAAGADVDMIWHLAEIVCGGIEPDLTVILDVDPRVGFRRIHGKKGKQVEWSGQFYLGFFRDRMEMKDWAYHEKVRQGFLAMASERPDRFVVVDASRAPDAVARDIESAVKRVLR